MSAHSESAASPAPCACTNISLMQLFHELKQKFPGVPDHVVSNTIELYCHDKHACETHLHSEAKASLTHAYHASSSAAARQLNELRVQAPLKCPNQPIVKHEVQNPITVTAVTCQSPQTASVSQNSTKEEIEVERPLINTDANQNVLEDEKDVKVNENNNNITSPVTVINIDNCIAKYSAESPSDLELTNASLTEREETSEEVKEPEQQGNINYRIIKSNKIRSCLNEKLEKAKEKKTIKKEDTPKKVETIPAQTQIKEEQSPSPQPPNEEKPKRPNTLEFLKPSPGIAFKEPPQDHPTDPNKAVSPAPPQSKNEPKETTPGGSYWPGNCPLNLSVNVNCHMDYARPYDPWLEDYESPRAVTSVNLTVCTPTSNMASPVREARDDDGGFEGHVTVTVSPSTGRPPRRRAPLPPQSITQPESQRSARSTVESSHERTLIERQKERLGRLAAALAQERGRVSQLKRESGILRAPLAPPAARQDLREYVHRLREQCDMLAKRLEMGGNEPESAEFYRNIYTGQRASARRPARPAPPPPDDAPTWECGVCTFRNHGLLDKCEACEMPHIVIGTSPARTLDSGFGSFRDRDRRVSQVDATFVPDVQDRPANRACV